MLQISYGSVKPFFQKPSPRFGVGFKGNPVPLRGTAENSPVRRARRRGTRRGAQVPGKELQKEKFLAAAGMRVAKRSAFNRENFSRPAKAGLFSSGTPTRH
jgi:hypothetical protein